MFSEWEGPAVLAGVGKGGGWVADRPDWETCWDMTTEEGGVISEGAAVAVGAGPPFDCEFIEGYGGEVGVLGWIMGRFVSVVLAAMWYGGEAGENEPVRRCRFAVCSDIEAAASAFEGSGCVG